MAAQMSFAEFSESVRKAAAPPVGLSPAVQALWWEAHGDWSGAHVLAQATEGTAAEAAGCWVHAYLHRKEGDPGNAAYWYARAGQPVAHGPLEEEWRRIVATLLEQG